MLFEFPEKIKELVSEIALSEQRLELWISDSLSLVKTEENFRFRYFPQKEELSKNARTDNKIEFDEQNFPCFEIDKGQGKMIKFVCGKGFIACFEGQNFHLIYSPCYILSHNRTLSGYADISVVKNNTLISSQSHKLGYFIPRNQQGVDFNQLAELIARILRLNTNAFATQGPVFPQAPNFPSNLLNSQSKSHLNDFSVVSEKSCEVGTFTLLRNNILLGRFSDILTLWIFIDEAKFKVILPNGDSTFFSIESPGEYEQRIRMMWSVYKEMVSPPEALENERQALEQTQRALSELSEKNARVIKFARNLN